MPFHWVRISSSPPQKRRDEVKQTCKEYGARLVGEEIYWDESGQAYALVEWRRDISDDEFEELLGKVGGTSWKGLVHADEKVGGTAPPSSKKREFKP
jgi:hypothetical protein